MLNKYIEIYKTNPELIGVLNQSRFLYDYIKNDIDENELKTIQMAMIVSPSFIHINSFMFEPLIDVGTEKLKEVATLIIDLV